MMKIIEGNMYAKVSNYKALEVSWNLWNPLNSISFEVSLDIRFKGDHTPEITMYVSFLCTSLFIDFYDSRHEEERVNNGKFFK